ncbi:protein-export chaperone SecB [Parvularcula flava]|uniref:Protein-export protein SecB n=1 Tax=Aquisalinus luteolus TaxID=1566827 RepID=A0A8J3A868_9PROT|nr:protein-export chaperone SecB [Aquisalinus luteolus]NHK28107.1 protein-export chaperone SecB [Aquisalinus luteolus]GGH97478.1 protein-export protein SecB [Aquisalinus luteolus]
MSETNNIGLGDGQTGDQPKGAVMRVASQYVKDLSFENPNAPISMQQAQEKPEIQLEVNLGARPMGDDFPMGKDFFEVEMSISARATNRDTKDLLYVVETNYAGLFLIQNVAEHQMGAALLVEGPRLLFPFARQVIAEAVRGGGFTPLMLEPLDFAGMYRAQLEQRASQLKAAGQNSDGSEPPAGQA